MWHSGVAIGVLGGSGSEGRGSEVIHGRIPFMVEATRCREYWWHLPLGREICILEPWRRWLTERLTNIGDRDISNSVSNVISFMIFIPLNNYYNIIELISGGERVFARRDDI